MSDEDNLELEELSSAEDFLNHFGIDYDPAVVHVNRLHILQRFHDYLSKAETTTHSEARGAQYKDLLTRAYLDFVDSNAQTEKVFKVFHQDEPQSGFVSIANIKLGSGGDAS